MKMRIYLFAIVCILLSLNSYATVAEQKDSVANDSVVSRQLEEVVVAADPKVVSVSGSQTSIKIKASPYDTAGSIVSILGNLPGMINTANNIEVKGYGVPIYVIDGNRVTDMQQLAMLDISRVNKVVIDTNPEMPYAAEAESVVYITTNKELSDVLSVRLGGTVSKERRWSGGGGPDIYAKLHNVTMLLGYDFNDRNTLLKETYFRIIDRPNGNYFSLEQPRRWYRSSQNHRINFSMIGIWLRISP